MFPICSVIFLSIIGLSVSLECKDAHPDACQKLKAQKNDMCSDPCLADVCRNTCNFCPLTCYSCKNKLYPEECNATIQCGSVHEYCIGIQELTGELIPLFQSGCADTKTCLNIFGDVHNKREVHRRDYGLKGGCCEKSKCNFHDPELAPVDQNPMIPSRPVYAGADGIFSKCDPQDVDADFCAALTAKRPDLCQKNCFAFKHCPLTCKTCRRCYDCKSVSRKEDCLATSLCEPGQRCVSVQQLGADFMITERLGCMNASLCDRYFGPVAAPAVGKRQLSSGSCCDADLCQHDAASTTPTTTPVPTTVPTDSTTAMPTTESTTVAVTSDAITSAAVTSAAVTNAAVTTGDTPAATTIAATTGAPMTTMAPVVTTEASTMPTSMVTNAVTENQTAQMSTVSTVVMTTDIETTTTATTAPPTTLPPCKDYDQDNICPKYVPIICSTADELSIKFAVAKCALSCNMCPKFYEYIAAGKIVINVW